MNRIEVINLAEEYPNVISDAAIAEHAELASDIRDTTSLLRKSMRANGIYEYKDMKYLDEFYRTRRMDPYYTIDGGAQEYLFFTKPDMNIFDGDSLNSQIFENSNIYGLLHNNIEAGVAASTYFQELASSGYVNTLADLCYSYKGIDNCPFVRILSNRKISNMDIPDISVTELETAQNMYGTKMFYPTTSRKSDEEAEFSIDFEDTQFLEVYHFFKAYDIYRQLKWAGLVMPKSSQINNKILADHMSIYKFIVDNDGETILYYAKATGVYPKTISRSSFSEVQEKGQLKITVNFKLSGWFEDMDPLILSDFNRLVANYVSNYRSRQVPIYDAEISAVSGESVKFFYVEREKVAYENDLNVKNYAKYYLVGGR